VSVKRDIVDHWITLPRDELVETVRLVVKQHDPAAKRTWAAVRENPLLAAKVRGALSALRADLLGSRDEVMWLMWINEARQALDQEVAANVVQHTQQSVPATASTERDNGEEMNSEMPAAQQNHRVSAAPAVPSVLFQQPGV
jgi:hypothetical protein